MTEASIGPIKFSVAHLQDMNNRFASDKEIKETGNILRTGKVTESEEFAVILENYLVKQLQGLNKWDEVFWVDTSPDLVDNEDPAHRGWYLLNFKEPIFGVNYAKLPVEARCISRNEMEYFEQDYTRINELPYDYPNPVTLSIEETFYSTYVDSNGAIKIDVAQKNTSKFPTVVDQVASDGADDVGWSNLNNIRADDSSYASCDFGGAGWSYWIRGKSFGHNIPSNAEITGLEIRSVHKQTCSTSGQKHWWDMKVYVGSASKIFYYGSSTVQSDIYQAQGGPNDKLGISTSQLTPSNVNNMMVAFATSGYSSSAMGYCDYVFAIVYWKYKTGTYQRFQPADTTKTNWGSINLSQTIPSGCSISWDIYRASDNLLLLGGQTGSTINISSLPHVNLRFVANMTASNGVSPSINSITVTETGSV